MPIKIKSALPHPPPKKPKYPLKRGILWAWTSSCRKNAIFEAPVRLAPPFLAPIAGGNFYRHENFAEKKKKVGDFLPCMWRGLRVPKRSPQFCSRWPGSQDQGGRQTESQALATFLLFMFLLSCDYYACPGALALGSACLARSACMTLLTFS